MTVSKIIKDINDVKNTIENYCWLKEKAEDLIVDKWHFNGVESVDTAIENGIDMLEISYTTYCMGETDYEWDSVPMSWLFLSDKELSEAKNEEREKRIEAKRKAEEENKAWRKKEEEHKEREQYEKLKAKYGE